MKTLIILFVLTVFGLPVHAHSNLRLSAEFQALHAESLLRTMDMALLGAADLIERKSSSNELIIHEALGNYVARAPGLRAIIATDAKGILTYDSFSYPARRIDLKDRGYIKEALQKRTRSIFIGTPMKGRTSGIAFLPMSQPTFSLDKVATGVVAGIITPDKLIRQNTLCDQCFVGLYKESGEKIVVYPSSLSYPEDFHDKRLQIGEGRILDHKIGDLLAETIWIRIKDYSLVLVFTRLSDAQGK